MARIKFKVVVLAALLFALSATAFAQLETGQITGRVTDPNGALVPGASVTESAVSRDALEPTVTCTRCVDLAKFCACTLTS